MNNTIRVLVFCHIALVSALLGIGAGLLSWVGGLNVPNSILSGAGTAGGAIVIFLAVIKFLVPNGARDS